MDHVRCVRDRSAFTKLWDDTLMDTVTGAGLGCKRVTRTGCLLGEKKSAEPVPRLEGLSSAKWDGKKRANLACPLVVRESHAGKVKEVQQLLAGETPSSLYAVPKAHQSRDEAVHNVCSKKPVSPDLIHEAAVDVSSRCHQVVVIAWHSLLRAKQCVSAERVCSC